MPCPYSTIYRSFDSLKALGLPPVLQGLPAPALSGSRISTALHERVGGLNRGNPSKRARKTIDRGSGTMRLSVGLRRARVPTEVAWLALAAPQSVVHQALMPRGPSRR